MSKEKYYRLDYKIGKNGAEPFSGARWNVEEFEWDPLDPSTYTLEFKELYQCFLPGSTFDVDCWSYTPHLCGSKRFLQLLEFSGARFHSVPFNLFCKTKKVEKIYGEFYIILILDNISMMDPSRSVYDVMKDLVTGQPVPAAPCTSHPRYEKIERFIFQDNLTPPPLYTCTETGWIMVSEKFAGMCQDEKIVGPTFTEITDGFQYDAFEGI